MSGGKKRNGQTIKCVACDKEFYVPSYRAKTAKFCSLNCQNHKQYEIKRLRFFCFSCKKEVEDSPSRIGARRKFCSIECKNTNKMSDKERRAKQKILVIRKRGTSTSRSLRKYIFSIKPKSCEKCGYDEYDFCLDLHHIDKNPNNNLIENISVLCCICHRKLHKGIE